MPCLDFLGRRPFRIPAMFALTDPGQTRDLNEDTFLLLPEAGLMAVFDGMGGHQAGDVASATACEVFRSAFEGGGSFRQLEAASDGQPTVVNALVEACSVSHERIQDLWHADPSMAGMGTTVAACVATNELLHVVHVGDSRVYRCGVGIELLTVDHSHVMQLVHAGRLTLEEARLHPDRNWILQALGGASALNPSVRTVSLADGDRIVVCSDGLWESMSNERMHEIVMAASDPAVACGSLVAEANAAGGVDNITVCVYFHRKPR